MSASLPQQWFDRAREDLQVARLVLQERHYAHACFLAQQCIEKALKAYLLEKANTYPRVHKLVDLLAECETLDAAFGVYRAECIVVDQYYIPTRYPDGVPGGLASGLPGETEAREALNAADEVFRFIATQLL
jgi:HEPN domain-containing protein